MKQPIGATALIKFARAILIDESPSFTKSLHNAEAISALNVALDYLDRRDELENKTRSDKH